jgi:WD40 repeat protein
VAGRVGDTVRLLELDTSLVRSLSGHRGPVTWVRFSPDGTRLVSGSEDTTGLVWDLARVRAEIPATRAERDWFKPDVASGGNIRALVGPEHELLWASTSSLGRWDLRRHAPLYRQLGVARPILAVALSPDGRLVATAGPRADAGSIQLWDAHTGARLRTLPVRDEVKALTFSPDGKQLAALVSQAHKPRLLTFEVAKAEPRLSLRAGRYECLAWSAGGLLAVSGQDKAIELLEAATGELRRTLAGLEQAWACGFSPDGKTLAVAGRSGVTLLDVESGRTAQRFATSDGEGVIELAFAADGSRLAGRGGLLGGPNRAPPLLYVWDLRTPRELQRWAPSGSGVTSISLSPDGKYLVAGQSGRVRTWNLP